MPIRTPTKEEYELMCSTGASNSKLSGCAVEAPYLKVFPQECETNADCLSATSDQIESICICKPNKKGKKYCSGFPMNWDEEYLLNL